MFQGLLMVTMGSPTSSQGKKKADVAEHPGVFNHVGLLVNGFPSTAGLSFI